MSLEVTLQNAISGLAVSRQSLQVISNNIANVNVEGYSRKNIEQTSRVLDGRGFGVELATVSRNIDEGVLRQLRTEEGELQRLNTKEEFLTQINRLFGRPQDNNSVTHLIADLASQFDALGITPETEATQFLTVKAAQDVIRELDRMSDEIQRLRAQTNLKINNAVRELNARMDSVVKLNFDIIEFRTSNISTADLEDQRDQALNKMSEVLDITYFEKNDGSVTVFSGGGATMIDGQKQAVTFLQPATMSATLTYTPPSATNFIAPGETGYPAGGVPGIFIGEQLASSDLTATVNSGQLKGLVDIRDAELVGLQAQIDELGEKLKNELNAVHNKGAGFPPAATLTGDRYVQSATSFNASGLIRVGIVNSSGVLQEDQVFDLSTISTVGALVTSLTAMTNMSASITSDGNLQLTGLNDFRVTVNELTSRVSGTGDSNTGFSDFFGLNNFITSPESFATYRTNLFTASGSAAVTTGGTLQFTGNDGTAFTETVNYSANASLSDIVTAINANANLQAENIAALLVSEGSGFRVQVSDSGGHEFAIVETGGGSLLADTGLRNDTRGISNRLAVRPDIVTNSFFISRGQLQSNTFQSANQTSATTNFTTLGVGAGNLTFTLSPTSTVTIAYAGADTLTTLASSINNNATLQAANISASVEIDGSNFRLKIVDADSDNYWLADSGGLSVDTTQGVTVGDGSVAADLAAEFATVVNFLAAPAAGGGLSETNTTFVDYSAAILSFNSAQVSSIERDLVFQEALRDELFAKNASVSGVNMDEELANMIVFEQAYLASARIITTTQELFRILTEMVR